MMHWMRRWWRQPHRFEWLGTYLEDRHLRRAAQLSIGGITASFAAVAAAMLWSPAGAVGTWHRAAAAAAAIIGALLALMWMTAWPSLNQSRLYVVVGNACIAVACLTQRDPLAGLTGCYAFVVLGAYIAVMHRAKATLYNFCVSIAVAMALAWQIANRGGDIILAMCEMAMLALFSIGAPVALQTVLDLMANDILRSDRDPLTGLLNRSGFYRHTKRLIARYANTPSGHLAVAMIDLDQFKRLNDSQGHAAGDRALIDVAHQLRHYTDAEAVVARVGGEEFLIAELCGPARSLRAADSLCRAIADTSHPVTASIGVTSVPLDRLDHQNKTVLIDKLIAQADAAMYDAKAAGGNQYQHRPLLDR